jgi:hypothetical protein
MAVRGKIRRIAILPELRDYRRRVHWGNGYFAGDYQHEDEEFIGGTAIMPGINRTRNPLEE